MPRVSETPLLVSVHPAINRVMCNLYDQIVASRKLSPLQSGRKSIPGTSKYILSSRFDLDRVRRLMSWASYVLSLLLLLLLLTLPQRDRARKQEGRDALRASGYGVQAKVPIPGSTGARRSLLTDQLEGGEAFFFFSRGYLSEAFSAK